MYIRPPYGNGTHVGGGSPEERWVFLRKVYLSLAIQMLLTVVVASIVVFIRPVNLFVSTSGGLVLYISSLILPIIVLGHLYHYYQSHPVNLLSLGVFTVAMSFAVGLTCAFTKGEIILESVILTLVVLVSLIVHTFWAEKKAREINGMGGQEQILNVVAFIFLLFVLIQLFFALERTLPVLCGGLTSLIFCAYIIYDTKNLIWVYSKEEYVWAAIAPYVDIFNYLWDFKEKYASVIVNRLRARATAFVKEAMENLNLKK